MTNTENTKELPELGRTFAALQASQDEVTRAVLTAKAEGSSWASIGRVLGITKQAAQQKYGKTPAVEPKLAEPDVAGPSVTPSIFLEPAAPAKAETGMPKTDTWTEPRKHGAILPGPKPKVAQPGTGKGPHLCPGCQSTNHHGSKRNTIVWNDGCIPTKYDPQATADYMNAR